MTLTRRVTDSAQSFSRRMCVMRCGALIAKRKPSGTWSNQPWINGSVGMR
jgi:hypothetical protein